MTAAVGRHQAGRTPAADVGDEVVTLVRAAQGGDSAALDQLLRTSLPLVYQVAARGLSAADADDVVQETMLRAVSGLRQVDRPERFRSWLLSIALRQARRRLARVGEDQRRFPAGDPDELAAGTDVADLGLDRVELSRQRREIHAAARWLDRDDRELLNLWWLTQAGDLRPVEVGPTLGISEAHARVRLHRLRGRLDSARRIERAVDAAGRGVGCRDVVTVLRNWPGVRSPLWRKRLVRHVDGCPACAQVATGLLPPETLLATVPLLVVPPLFLPQAGVAPAATGLVAAAVEGVRQLVQALLAKPAAAAMAAVAVGGGAAAFVVHEAEDEPRPRTALVAPTPATAPASSAAPAPAPPGPSRPAARASRGGVGAGIGGPTWSAEQTAPLQGGRYLYVAPSGDDGNSGLAQDQPFRTLQRAADQTRPGDTVLIADGRYSAPGRANVLGVTRSGEPDRWITFAAAPNARPVIEGGDGNWQIVHVRAAYIRVVGLSAVGNRARLTAEQRDRAQRGDLKDPTINGNCFATDEQKSADPPRRPHHVHFWGNTATDCALAGFVALAADHVTMEYNVAARNSWYSGYAGSCFSMHSSWNSDDDTGFKMIMRGNVAHDCRQVVPSVVTGADRPTNGNGFSIQGNRNEDLRGAPLFQDPYRGRILVADNVAYGNGGHGILVHDSDNVAVVNNTLYRNAETPHISGEVVVRGAERVAVANNIAVARAGKVAAGVTSAPTSRLANNLLVGAQELPDGIARGTLAGQPSFVDPDTGDFRLNADSPAVDSGAPTSGSTTDADRLPRDGRPDLGAYERR
ncbi:sigma-70 family RNA polymerase sigma factor [Micromonospora endolithica]|uniref:Sigma-70 family RNA polymerase sigma factor n=1 Tax=Micromonospora endolithica TaxID=230091 RepID=A0A3A9YTW5_9ACTN|nr:sigma-70 family RNA polymerase sigma factor [Micromonospora endolithica]RKN38686.1 sigma-70 family RNA polymerase sigma factor [Micromonospora endolithica]TWJ25303.1 RNA polymerase sigma factor (sigma-70 family) [Micromonospora endolithica]